MAKISSLVLLIILTIAATSISAPADAAVISNAGLKKAADVVEKWKKRIEDAGEIFDFINKTTHGKLLPGGRRNDDALLPGAVSVAVVHAGGVNFPVAGVDVTSPVTWTTRCSSSAAAGRPVPCGDPLCDQYGSCTAGGSSAAQVCNSTSPAGVPLHKGKIALLGGAKASTSSKEIFSTDDAAYACGGGAADEDYAVIGLGRDNAILAKLSSFALFSYIVDADLQGSTVWLAHNAILADTAGGRSTRRGTTRLASDESHRSFYTVGITGIKVAGAGEEKEQAVGILMTTMPFTILKPSLFEKLNKSLSAAVASSLVSGGGSGRFRQLCYPKGTDNLPAITLVFAGENAEMELRPEHYSYTNSNGVVCLSILPSPWSSGESVIGSMVQAGRRMTYKLDDSTLTFDVTVSSASSSVPSPSSVATAAAAAALTPLSIFLSSAWVMLLLASIIM